MNGTSHLYVAAKQTVCNRLTNIVLIMVSHNSYIFIFLISQFCEMLLRIRQCDPVTSQLSMLNRQCDPSHITA